MKRKSLGISFKDEVDRVSVKSGQLQKNHPGGNWEDLLLPNYNPEYDLEGGNPWRILGLLSFCTILFFILFIRLFHLQIVKGVENRELADGNRIAVKLIHTPRGVIFDRNGKILAANEPGFRLIEKKGAETKISYISRDAALKMEVDKDSRLSNLEIDNIRSYLEAEKMAHILGYVGEITKEELSDPKFSGTRVGDKIGRGGVEEIYQKDLRGIDGGEIIEVNSKGEKLRTLRKIDPIPGNNLYLSIDSDLQSVVYETLKNALDKSNSCCGAAVVADPKSGEILALVSLPSFDPANLEGALIDKQSPILNRVIGGLYPPGSTFKIASALAGLSSGKINAKTQFEDTGVINLGPYKFTNWYFNQYGKTEGWIDLEKALKRSNDIFFYQLGALIGENALSENAKKLGLGKVSGIDLPGETAGVVPDPAWKKNSIGEIWYPGDTMHMAIGQGYVLTTPLQILGLTSYVAADGKNLPPHLATKIVNSRGKLIKEFKYESKKETFKEADMKLVQKGLSEVPTLGGTAWPFFTFPITTAGKTGTAEYGDLNKTHAWYTGYGSADEPKIVATVLVEGGGEGSSVAAPVVKEIFRWFLSEDKNNLIKDIGSVATDSARTLGE